MEVLETKVEEECYFDGDREEQLIIKPEPVDSDLEDLESYLLYPAVGISIKEDDPVSSILKSEPDLIEPEQIGISSVLNYPTKIGRRKKLPTTKKRTTLSPNAPSDNHREYSKVRRRAKIKKGSGKIDDQTRETNLSCHVSGLTQSNSTSADSDKPKKCVVLIRRLPRRSSAKPVHSEINSAYIDLSHTNSVSLGSLKARKSRRRNIVQVQATKEDKIITCEECGISFADVSKLKSHQRIHRARSEKKDVERCNESKCEKCGKTFSRPSGLKYHEEHVHIEDDAKGSIIRKFICETCGKKFIKKSHLVLHNQAHTGVKLFPCRVVGCNKRFNGSTGRKLHEEKCNGVSVLESVDGVRTAQRSHKRKDGSPVVIPGRKICMHCGKTFKVAAHCKRHERIHTGEKCKCTYEGCEASFAMEISLKEHTNVVHTGEVPFKCTYAGCGATFARSLNFKYHVKTKHQITKFICTTCGKDFQFKPNLIRHETIHKGIKAFICTICGMAFREAYKLRKHSKVHLKPPRILKGRQPRKRKRKLAIRDQTDKPFTERLSTAKNFLCSFPNCSKAFVTKRNLEIHIRKHDAILPNSTTAVFDNTQIQTICNSYGAHPQQTTSESTFLNPFPDSSQLNYSNFPAWPQVQSTQTGYEIPPVESHQWGHSGHQTSYSDTRSADGSGYVEGGSINMWDDDTPDNNEPVEHVHQSNSESDNSDIEEIPEYTKTNKSLRMEQPLLIIEENPKFACGICGRRYLTQTEVTSHANVHNCLIGHERTTDENTENDVNIVEARPRIKYNTKLGRLQQSLLSLDCEICQKSFKRQCELIRHRMVHDLNFHPFKCKQPNCTATFRHVVLLRKHFYKDHPNAQQIKCELCQMSFSNSKYLDVHRKRIHDKSDPVKVEADLALVCNICQSTFKRKNDLSRHKMIHDSTIRPFKCREPDCQEVFRSVILLRAHIQNDHPNSNRNKCELCQICFNSPKTLHNHQMTVHLDCKYSCSHPDCDRTFKSSGSLKFHVESAHVSQNSKIIYRCPECPKEFKSEIQMLSHKRNVHKPGVVRKFRPLFHTCEICERNFERPWALRRHMLSHNNENQPFKCPEANCGKGFNRLDGLNNHLLRKHSV